MVGAIIGDIVGSVYEFNNIKTKNFDFFSNNCKFTDDTIMTIAIFKALQDCKNEFADKNSNERIEITKNSLYPEYKNLAQNAIVRMREYGNQYLSTGFGKKFLSWLTQENPEPYNSWGNGAAMRVSPVAYFAKSLSEAKFLSYQVTAVTHNHPDGIKGAEATAVATYMALHGKTKEQIKKSFERKYYPLDFDYEELKKTYKYHMACKNCVPQAIYCFLISDSFEDAIRTCVSIGGDTDTLCAITGAVAGAFYGIPEKIENQAFTFLDERLKLDYNQFKNMIQKKEIEK